LIALLQCVSEASVSVEGRVVAEINQGILALIGIQPDDTEAKAQRLLERILAYRIFEDTAGRMNCSLRDIDGELLLVPQFTLAADTRKGLRPGFSTAAPPALAEALYRHIVARARAQWEQVQSGLFGAKMNVELTNVGPATFWLEC